jgi:hypothetical protein
MPRSEKQLADEALILLIWDGSPPQKLREAVMFLVEQDPNRAPTVEYVVKWLEDHCYLLPERLQDIMIGETADEFRMRIESVFMLLGLNV